MCAFLPSPGLHPSANVTKEALQKMRTSVTKGLDYHLNHPWNKVLAIKTDEIKKCMAQAGFDCGLIVGKSCLYCCFKGTNIQSFPIAVDLYSKFLSTCFDPSVSSG